MLIIKLRIFQRGSIAFSMLDLYVNYNTYLTMKGKFVVET